MKNKFLTIQVWRFLYHMARIKKRKPKPLVRKMSEQEWVEVVAICKELNINL